MSRSVKISQITMVVCIALYILETIIFSGMFTNLLIGAIALLATVVAGIIAVIKKKYTISLVDLSLLMSTVAFLAVVYSM